jgi:hypothetical protein
MCLPSPLVGEGRVRGKDKKRKFLYNYIILEEREP